MHKRNGFSLVEGVLILALVAVVGSLFWFGTQGNKQKTSKPAITDGKQAATPTTLLWQQTQAGWQSTQTPPACPAQPIMQAPTDLRAATAVLYPGQTRGGNYKPHGGFRFDTAKDNAVKVTAPIDGYIVRGGQYLSSGEIQYTFDVMNNCGVMYRVGHIRRLPDSLQKLTATWPAAAEGDSRTQSVSPALFVTRGTTLGTSVGIIASKNVFFDWGVYDYRQTNQASTSVAYQQAHQADQELAWHAVCWFDWLPTKDSALIRSLPAGDPTSGKTSDYCKS